MWPNTWWRFGNVPLWDWLFIVVGIGASLYIGITWYDQLSFNYRLAFVQTQIGFPVLFVWPVACVAGIGEDRFDVSDVIDRFFRTFYRKRQGSRFTATFEVVDTLDCREPLPGTAVAVNGKITTPNGPLDRFVLVTFTPVGGGVAIEAEVENDGTYLVELAEGDYDAAASRPGYESVAVAAFAVVDGELQVHRGVLSQQNLTIPLERVQSVSIEQDLSLWWIAMPLPGLAPGSRVSLGSTASGPASAHDTLVR